MGHDEKRSFNLKFIFYFLLSVTIIYSSLSSCKSAPLQGEASNGAEIGGAYAQLVETYSRYGSLSASGSISGKVGGESFQYLIEIKAVFGDQFPFPREFSIELKDVIFYARTVTMLYKDNSLTYSDHARGESYVYDLEYYRWNDFMELPLPMDLLITFLSGSLPSEIIKEAPHKEGVDSWNGVIKGGPQEYSYSTFIRSGIIPELTIGGEEASTVRLIFEGRARVAGGRYFPQSVTLIAPANGDYLTVRYQKVVLGPPRGE